MCIRDSGKTFVLTEDITIDTSELETSFNANNAPIRAFDGIFDGDGHTAVSYTHLDVYKRQRQASAYSHQRQALSWALL